MSDTPALRLSSLPSTHATSPPLRISQLPPLRSPSDGFYDLGHALDQTLDQNTPDQNKPGHDLGTPVSWSAIAPSSQVSEAESLLNARSPQSTQSHRFTTTDNAITTGETPPAIEAVEMTNRDRDRPPGLYSNSAAETTTATTDRPPRRSRQRTDGTGLTPVAKLMSWLRSRLAPVVYGTGVGLGLLAFVVESRWGDRSSQISDAADCTEAVLVDAALTPETLAQVTAKLGQARTEVVQILGTPHCSLPKMSVRYGAIAERDAYRLDDARRVVAIYEEDALVGVGVETVSAPRSMQQASLVTTTDPPAASDRPRLQEVNVQQSWGVQIGDAIGSASVVGGLGDVSLAHRGQVFAPVDGWVEGEFVTIVGEQILTNEPGCVLFSSPQLPSYLMKACGLVQHRLGAVEAGQSIGRTGGVLHVSLLSRRRDGSADAAAEAEWVYVSPAPEFLAQTVSGTTNGY